MPSRIRDFTGRQHRSLLTGWSLCSTPPGAFESPQALALGNPHWLPTDAPSTVAACLRAANSWSLDSPPRRFDAEDWWYRARFARPALRAHEHLMLGFDGLATVAQVWLNDALLLASENMFVAHECRIDERLEDDNELLIRFRALDSLLAARRPRPRWRVPMVEHQQLRWFRTTVLGRTPGWSPPAAPVGPWRPIWLETRTRFSVANLRIHTAVEGGAGLVDVECEVAPIGDSEIRGVMLVIRRQGKRYSIPLQQTRGTDSYAGRLQISDVALWWPHTHGDPALYEAHLQVGATGSTEDGAVDLGRIGFRTLALDLSNGDFALRVNGVPVFCRGACWTPIDPVSLSASGEALSQTLAQVRAAGMNMLRVGGTMVYESDEFLDGCDSNGILLWQDFMFANMEYPQEDAAFAESVDTEARQQLARLAGRPCLAVLCGNSEGEQQAAMWGAPRASWSPVLFHQVLARIAGDWRPDVPYWPSSAHGGAIPHQANEGTTSYYGVGAYLRPLEDARRSELRFASECLAFANVPEDHALEQMPGGLSLRSHHPAWKARSPRDLGAGWDFEDVRDHYLTRLFGVDPLELRYADHERYLALSRVVSGEVMAATFGEWRRKRSACRGGLIWFLRDLWCGAGWGIIDALGTPKAAYHYVRRSLQPLAVFISDEGGNGLYVHVSNEHAEPINLTLELALFRLGDVSVARAGKALCVPARSALELAAGELFDGFLDLSYAYRFGPPSHDLVVATLSDAQGSLHGQAFHFIPGRALAREADLGLAAAATARADGGFDLCVRTRRFAQAVRIEADGYIADDNYFHLAPGAERTVALRAPVERPTGVLRGRIHALNALTSTKIHVTS